MFLLSLTSTFLIGEDYVQASATSQAVDGKVTVEDPGTSSLIDPEFPEVTVNPGEGPSTKGSLRIDYVSSLNFGTAKIDKDNRTYNSLAQLFHSDTGARGYYIQVSDYSSESSGWSLTVTQEEQFHSSIVQNLDKQQLNGAVLSFDKGWANTNGSSETPTVTRDTLAINEMGVAYKVASASKGQGKGIWTIEFGASQENTSQQSATLSALQDATGKAVMDTTYNKPAYSNSAVTLTIPKETKIYPVQYTTSLTWTLTAGPTE